MNVVEPNLVDFLAAVDRGDRTHTDAGIVHIDEEDGNAFLLLTGAVGAYEAENEIRVLGVRSPCLGAVDHVVLTVTNRTSLQGGKVRAGVGLRIALAPPVFAAKDSRRIVGFFASFPNFMMTGPTISRPNELSGGVPALAHSSSKM